MKLHLEGYSYNTKKKKGELFKTNQVTVAPNTKYTLTVGKPLTKTDTLDWEKEFDKEIGIIEGYKLCITYEDQNDQDVEHQVKSFIRSLLASLLVQMEKEVIGEDEIVQKTDDFYDADVGMERAEAKNSLRKQQRAALKRMKI